MLKAATIETNLEAWRAYHVFYHADHDELLRQLAVPLFQGLLQTGAIDRFFFVRYNLGGPHVRLRWRLASPNRTLDAEAMLAERTSWFFSRLPSSNPLPEERIRNMHRSLLGLDPAVRPDDDVIYPDNSYRSFPIDFEIERYGGISGFSYSLDFFTLSSVHILRLLCLPKKSANWRRSTMLRLGVRLAWAFSGGDQDMFVDLAGYGVKLMGENFAACAEEGDQMFTRRAAELMDAIGRELEDLGGSTNNQRDGDGLEAGCFGLAFHTNDIVGWRRWSIAASHIHMTANRLGISNTEEVYLSRMLWRTVNMLRTEMPEKWRRWWAGFPAPQQQSCFLEDAVTSALASFANVQHDAIGASL